MDPAAPPSAVLSFCTNNGGTMRQFASPTGIQRETCISRVSHYVFHSYLSKRQDRLSSSERGERSKLNYTTKEPWEKPRKWDAH